MIKFSIKLLIFILMTNQSVAVLYGDENYGDIPGGRFWAFYENGVALIDPETCSIENQYDNSAFPTTWSDGVYMQYDPSSYDAEDKKGMQGLVLINSRTNVVDPKSGEQKSHVWAFKTDPYMLLGKIEVGPQVVHSYGIHKRDEYWTHSDGDGYFYIIKINDLTEEKKTVAAHHAVAQHGKLLWDEDGTLGTRGFATSTGEQYLFEVDMEAEEDTQKFDFSVFVEEGTCRGLHAIAYSSKNQHVYSECVGGGGILEFDVSGGSMKFVHQHMEATGALYEIPDGSGVVASNKSESKIHIFKPNEVGSKSSVEFDVDVPGHPSTVSFYPKNNGKRESDFTMCAPLTENTNLNHIDDSGKIICDYYSGCNGASSEEDVSNGLCAYNKTSPKILTRANLASGGVSALPEDQVGACERCNDESNYDETGTCVCTPTCGKCDPNFDHDPTRPGVVCMDLYAIMSGQQFSLQEISEAGAVSQGYAYDGTECGFGRTYRRHKRGGIYDASVANYPEHSIQIIDMENVSKKCDVSLPSNPSTVIYAPLSPVKVDDVGYEADKSEDTQSTATNAEDETATKNEEQNTPVKENGANNMVENSSGSTRETLFLARRFFVAIAVIAYVMS